MRRLPSIFSFLSARTAQHKDRLCSICYTITITPSISNSSQMSVRNSPKLIFGPIDRSPQPPNLANKHLVDNNNARKVNASAGPHLVAIDTFLTPLSNLLNMHLQPPFQHSPNSFPSLFPDIFFYKQDGRRAHARQAVPSQQAITITLSKSKPWLQG